jgi:GxxExxY protein
MMKPISQKTIDDLSYKIIGAAIEVHKILGPGLLESSYEKALLHELSLRGLKTSSQKRIEVPYKGIVLDCELRYDVLG